MFCVQVCRSAGYYEHALYVAQAAKEPEWYLDILLEDCQQYDEALAYLQDLPRQQAAAALTRHGKVALPALREVSKLLTVEVAANLGRCPCLAGFQYIMTGAYLQGIS